jgi:hypothetical protein
MRNDSPDSLDLTAEFRRIAREEAAKVPPRTFLTEREAETFLRWAPQTLAVRRCQGKPVPPSYGTGKLRRYAVDEVDAWVRAGSGTVAA